MKLHIGRSGTLASLGLICAAALWALNVQLGEILPYPGCRYRLPLAGFSSLTIIAAVVAAGWWSWRTRQALKRRPGHPVSDARRTLGFLGGIGTGAALLFLFALTLQALAGFILTGCER